MLDIYDLVYEQAVKNPSGTQWQELLAIQDTVSMLGQPPHRGRLWATQPPHVACDPENGHRAAPRVSRLTPGTEQGFPGNKALMPLVEQVGGGHQHLLSFSLCPGQGWLPNVRSPEQNETPVVQRQLRIAGCSLNSIKQGPGRASSQRSRPALALAGVPTARRAGRQADREPQSQFPHPSNRHPGVLRTACPPPQFCSCSSCAVGRAPLPASWAAQRLTCVWERRPRDR